jgi:hypothetical protein
VKVQAKGTALALLVAACGLSTDPALEAGSQESRQIAVSIGQDVVVPGTALRVGFLGLESDSRCPTGVVCVWQGDAAAKIGLTAGSGPTHPQVLHTALEPGSVDFGGVRVTLLDVAPWPVDGQPTDPDDYVVTLRVEPAPT